MIDTVKVQWLVKEFECRSIWFDFSNHWRVNSTIFRPLHEKYDLYNFVLDWGTIELTYNKSRVLYNFELFEGTIRFNKYS